MTDHPELDALVCAPMKANLSVRAYNALASAGLCTLKQVRAADLTRVKNMGPKLRRFVQKRVAVALAVEEADFVRVDRWECRIACGGILKEEEIADHRCGVPLSPLSQDDVDVLREWIDGTDWDAAGSKEGQAANVVARLLNWSPVAVPPSSVGSEANDG